MLGCTKCVPRVCGFRLDKNVGHNLVNVDVCFCLKRGHWVFMLGRTKCVPRVCGFRLDKNVGHNLVNVDVCLWVSMDRFLPEFEIVPD